MFRKKKNRWQQGGEISQTGRKRGGDKRGDNEKQTSRY